MLSASFDHLATLMNSVSVTSAHRRAEKAESSRTYHSVAGGKGAECGMIGGSRAECRRNGRMMHNGQFSDWRASELSNEEHIQSSSPSRQRYWKEAGACMLMVVGARPAVEKQLRGHASVATSGCGGRGGARGGGGVLGGGARDGRRSMPALGIVFVLLGSVGICAAQGRVPNLPSAAGSSMYDCDYYVY